MDNYDRHIYGYRLEPNLSFCLIYQNVLPILGSDALMR